MLQPVHQWFPLDLLATSAVVLLQGVSGSFGDPFTAGMQLATNNYNLRNVSNLAMGSMATISGVDRLHLTAPDQVYMYPKMGVTIGKHEQASGSLTTEGPVIAGEGVVVPNQNGMYGRGRIHMSAADDIHFFPKNGVAITRHQGGSGSLVVDGTFTSRGMATFAHNGTTVMTVGNAISVEREILSSSGCFTMTNGKGRRLCISIDGNMGLWDLKGKLLWDTQTHRMP
jgi:hypothetical protein